MNFLAASPQGKLSYLRWQAEEPYRERTEEPYQHWRWNDATQRSDSYTQNRCRLDTTVGIVYMQHRLFVGLTDTQTVVLQTRNTDYGRLQHCCGL